MAKYIVCETAEYEVEADSLDAAEEQFLLDGPETSLPCTVTERTIAEVLAPEKTKSDIIKELAEKLGLPVIDLPLHSGDPDDIYGIPTWEEP